MADLPTIAQRMNDTEVTANAPITETLMRRFGSNVNFILDYLGVTNGETSPSGALSDLSVATALIDAHTIDQQLNITTSGVSSVGTFTQTKYVNQVFYLVASSTSGAGALLDVVQDAAAVGNEISVLFNIDGGGNKTLPVFRDNGDYDNAYVRNLNETGDPASFSKMIGLGSYDFSSATPLVVPIAILDWRDPGTSFQVLVNVGNNRPGVNDTIRIYREYILAAGSLGF